MAQKHSTDSFQTGMTLIELVVVVAILVVLAGFIVPRLTHLGVNARATAASASLAEIRNAIMGTADKPGYLSDNGQLPNQMADLFVNKSSLPLFNRDTGLGWRGPYLIASGPTYPANDAYGSVGDPAVFDPWGHPIIIQHPTTGATPAINASFTRLISAGPNGIIDTPTDYAGTPYPPYTPQNQRGDDIVLFLNHADSYP